MAPNKTLQQREKELRLPYRYPTGRKELQELESRYQLASGKSRPRRTSIITYILVHEREQGLISS